MLAHNKFLEVLIASYMMFAAGCASLPDNINRQASYAFTDTDDTSLGQLSGARIQAEGQGHDGFLLLKSGLDA